MRNFGILVSDVKYATGMLLKYDIPELFQEMLQKEIASEEFKASCQVLEDPREVSIIDYSKPATSWHQVPF
jgi:hypothetical protein